MDTVSLDTYDENGELFDDFGDNGFQANEALSQTQQEYMLRSLTRRQLKVTELIVEGYGRKEIAEKLGVTLQAIHQIVPRIRKRMLKIPTVNPRLGRKFNDV